jgi:hypothetical protein
MVDFELGTLCSTAIVRPILKRDPPYWAHPPVTIVYVKDLEYIHGLICLLM